jgi:Flp pilus assembly protein TadD
MRTGKPDAAREILTPLTSDKDLFVKVTVRLAKIEAAEKNLTEAKRLLDGALARDPRDLDALTTKGRLLLAEGNSVNALSTLKTAADSNPRSVDARIALAQTYAMRGETKEATAAYNEALSLDAGNAEARLGLAQVQISNGQAADAVPLLLKVVQEHPRSLAARLAFFEGLMAVGDVPQAQAQLAAAQQIDPESVDVQNAAGMLAAAKQDQAGARTAYARALAANPRSYQALAGLLTAEMQSKNFGAAKELIEKQLAKMPNDPNVLLMAAQTYDALGDAVETERALKKTVEADPQSLQGYAMLGKLYYEQGRLENARVELEKYVATAPMSVPGNTMLGTILDMQGKTAEAKKRYGKALQIDPRAAVAANNLAWINANGNESLDVALQLAQTAKSQLPSRHEIDDTLGWVYYRKGLYSMAIDSLRTSAQKQPDNPIYNYHLAVALQKNGNNDEARRLLEKVVASKKNFDGSEDAKRLLAQLKGTN